MERPEAAAGSDDRGKLCDEDEEAQPHVANDEGVDPGAGAKPPVRAAEEEIAPAAD
jgi:hypothetical protein